MLTVSEAVVGAFERGLSKDELHEFARWWSGQRGQLGAIDSSQLAALLANARQQAQSLGIDDNQANRLFILAAAIRLVPTPDARQYLLIADAIFDSDSDEERLGLLAGLAPRR